jgi:hypothetical protein
MFTMAVGQGDEVDPSDAIATAIHRCRATLGGQTPQAGVLFSAFDSFDPSILAAVAEAFPTATVMGTTSAAEISSIDGYQEDSIILAMFASDTVDISAGMGTGLAMDVDAACRSAVDEAMAVTQREPRVCVVLTEGFTVDPQRTLDAMARALPAGVTMVGGTSVGHDFASTRPSFQFCAERVSDDGVAVLLFSGPIAHSTALGTGWRTLGATGTVTRAGSGVVHEIDGQPAITFLARYLDVTGPASFGNPLAVVEVGSDESYLRAILGTDPSSGSIFVAGVIPVGAVVQLTTAETAEILAGAEAALHRATAEFPAGARPEAALIFSCAVRRFLLGSRTGTEADLARSVYGASMPIAGLYCNGEIGPIRGTASSRYFNETFTTLLLGT